MNGGSAQGELWWKNAVVYCLDVETYLDSNGDGIGDFRGLSQRVDYLAGLGIDCIWLMPFYPSVDRDDGYDVTDYYGVDPRLGDLGDFDTFVRTARNRGIRVIADLVVNHTSIEHPWFQDARANPDSEYRRYYVWRDEPPEDWKTSLIFPGEQEANWTYDRTAGQYYLHRFYSEQPDLNPEEPAVREELKQVIGFWLQQGLSGFRVDAVPFLIELMGAQAQEGLTPHGFLEDLRGFLSRRRGDAVLLGEVNLPPVEQRTFFGDGDQLHLVFNFFVNQHLYLALAREDPDPLRKAMQSLPEIPGICQWANFVRNHDELNLDKLTESERGEVFAAFGPEARMQLFGRGLRRRLPTMLGGDQRRIRLAYSLLFSLPGTPVLFYGEEIGMGENLAVDGRLAVRTPMQWLPERNGGFSTAAASDLRRPLARGPYGPKRVNVADQRRDPDSLLNWVERAIRRRRETPELGFGAASVIDVGDPSVLAHRCDWEDRTIVALHNFRDARRTVDLGDETRGVTSLVDVLSDRAYDAPEAGAVDLGPFGYRWIRLRRRGQTQLL